MLMLRRTYTVYCVAPCCKENYYRATAGYVCQHEEFPHQVTLQKFKRSQWSGKCFSVEILICVDLQTRHKSAPAQCKAIQAATPHDRKSIHSTNRSSPSRRLSRYMNSIRAKKLSELARAYEFPHSRLWSRIKGRVSRSDRPASNRLFKEEQENTL
jgi:hypothetical protein